MVLDQSSGLAFSVNTAVDSQEFTLKSVTIPLYLSSSLYQVAEMCGDSIRFGHNLNADEEYNFRLFHSKLIK